MTTYVCSNCGERNAPGTTFCVNCHAFLAWDEVEGGDDERDAEGNMAGEATVIPARPDTQARQQHDENDVGTVLRPPGSSAPEGAAADGGDGRLQVTAEQKSVTVPATGQPATLTVRVMNTS
ncbi:MAG TPA: zinc-ribbon domain-containing protein, partial [Propionibacteriaceae bacterium]|nr:zinc-ribbon domain-containing protein [Propionibacteriaceae bacterium]